MAAQLLYMIPLICNLHESHKKNHWHPACTDRWQLDYGKNFIMNKLFYFPVTAAPFRQNEEYKEVLPQNLELSKYIRCFWGSIKPYFKKDTPENIVIPDTCADIIYYIDYTENKIDGMFCGINDTSFLEKDNTKNGHLVSIFAIRFYAWGAYKFSQDSMKETMNKFRDVQFLFGWLDRIIRQQLFFKSSLEERAVMAEEIFLKYMPNARQNNIIDNAAGNLILGKGAISVAGLADSCFISSRQLERVFNEYTGITPKKLINLVRYQFLWNEILRNKKLDILDAVYRYGYTDQSHLIREFKRYHTMGIQKAKEYARNNVGNIQYFHNRN